MKKARLFLVIITATATLLISAGLSCRQQPSMPGSLVPPEQVMPKPSPEDPPPAPDIARKKEIGDPAPDFTLQTIDGQTITLSHLRGKNVILTFWVVACPACLEELPYIQTVYNKLPRDRIEVLAVNAGERDKLVQYEAQRMKLTFPVLLDPDGKVCKSYGRGSPTTFFINGEGIIIEILDEVFESTDEIETTLKSLGWN